MTTEEKAIAYDEAIKVAKGLFNSPRTCFDIDQLTNIFPQLAESEDERIIRLLRELGSLDAAKELYEEFNLSYTDVLYWLEKQKEKGGYEAIPVESTLEYKLGFNAGRDSEKQKERGPLTKEEEYTLHRIIEYLEDETCPSEWISLLHDIYCLPYEKRKEQTSNLVPKIIRPKFAVGDTVCRNMWSDHTIREIYIDCNDPVYVCVNDEGLESHISFSEQDEWERKEPKPAEWSGEDEEMFFFINELLENKGRDYFTTLVYDAVQNWLKNRFKSLRPQPKKELSIEKAIQWLDDTFYFLDNSSGRGRDCEITTHDFDSLEEMYDSFRKAVTVDSKPHWKPSEEQMEVLKKALYINPASGKLHELKENEVCILQGLLKQLEKL